MLNEFIKAMRELFIKLGKIWAEVRKIIKRMAEIDDKVKQKERVKMIWCDQKVLPLKNQVINNKPKHLVRKIIK